MTVDFLNQVCDYGRAVYETNGGLTFITNNQTVDSCSTAHGQLTSFIIRCKQILQLIKNQHKQIQFCKIFISQETIRVVTMKFVVDLVTKHSGRIGNLSKSDFEVKTPLLLHYTKVISALLLNWVPFLNSFLCHLDRKRSTLGQRIV